MVSRVLIDGYKSIGRLEMELENFTLLSGVNSAGKSSVIQAVLYVLQMEKQYGRFPAGRNSDFGKFVDIRNNIKGNKEIQFELDIQEGGTGTATIGVNMYVEGGLDKVTFRISGQGQRYTDRYRAIHLSVERVGVQNFYPLSASDPGEIGDRGEYVYSYLALYGQESLAEEAFAYDVEQVGLSMNNQVNYWLEYLMGFRIQTRIVQDVDQVVVTYSNVGNNRYYRPQNVGTGVTYMSMLIIAALSCQKGDMLIIENPEIHMHPRAQSRFVELLAFLTGRGLQVILETHSDHIYNGMRKCVKNGKLRKEQTAAYFLELDESMQTKADRIRFNDQGAEENHPYGLFDQFDDDLDELLGI